MHHKMVIFHFTNLASRKHPLVSVEKLHLGITDGPWVPWASLKVSGAQVQSDGCMGPVSTNPLHLEVQLAEAVVQRASMGSQLRP